MRTGIGLSILSLGVLALSLSCAGGDEEVLARIGDEMNITSEDFQEAFDNLDPQFQVRVLDPGGKLSLVQRLVDKALLELEVERRDLASDERAVWWQELYETSFLSELWLDSFDSGFPVLVTEDSSWVHLFSERIDLVVAMAPDSAAALQLAELWEAGAPAALDDAPLAPWNDETSCLGRFTGTAADVPPELYVAFGESNGEIRVSSLYGLYAVGIMTRFTLDSPPDLELDQGTAGLLYVRALRDSAAIAPLSAPIGELSERLVVTRDGMYAFDSTSPPVDEDAVLCEYRGGVITAGDVVRLVDRITPRAFIGSTPEEMTALAPPAPSPLGPGPDLWFYVHRLAQVSAQAEAARAAGLTDGLDQARRLALVEELLRREVVEPNDEPDSARVLAYYEENRDLFYMPERRSILLAYVPADSLDAMGAPRSFADVSRFSPRDDNGDPIPTPLQVRPSFGPLGDAVFSAGEGEFAGPFGDEGEGIQAFMQVLEIAEEGYLEPDEIWDSLTQTARQHFIVDGLEAFLEELADGYGVEIDSIAVNRVDPWSQVY